MSSQRIQHLRIVTLLSIPLLLVLHLLFDLLGTMVLVPLLCVYLVCFTLVLAHQITSLSCHLSFIFFRFFVFTPICRQNLLSVSVAQVQIVVSSFPIYRPLVLQLHLLVHLMLQFKRIALIVFLVYSFHFCCLLAGLLNLLKHLFFLHLQLLDSRLHNRRFKMSLVRQLLRVQHASFSAHW